MKYTKAFEKYWDCAERSDLWEWGEVKRIAFLAWQAGIKKTKKDYHLIKEHEADRKLSYFQDQHDIARDQ